MKVNELCLQNIDGWYFLLSEELGRSKHLKVSPSDSKISNQKDKQPKKKTKSNVPTAKPSLYTSTPRIKYPRDLSSVVNRDADDTMPSLLSLNMLQESYVHRTTTTTADPSQLRLSMLDSTCKTKDLDVVFGKKVPDKVG